MQYNNGIYIAGGELDALHQTQEMMTLCDRRGSLNHTHNMIVCYCCSLVDVFITDELT